MLNKKWLYTIQNHFTTQVLIFKIKMPCYLYLNKQSGYLSSRHKLILFIHSLEGSRLLAFISASSLSAATPGETILHSTTLSKIYRIPETLTLSFSTTARNLLSPVSNLAPSLYVHHHFHHGRL